MNTKNQPWKAVFKVFFILLVATQGSNTQNQLAQTIDASGIDRVLISGNDIFEINVQTIPGRQIKLASIVDGEYGNYFDIGFEQNRSTLEFFLMASDLIEIPDDKRNAHKVVSAAIELYIPEDLNLEVISDVGSLEAKGVYNTINAKLQNGFCIVKGTAVNMHIETVEGGISLATKNTTIEASSAHGSVNISQAVKGKHMAKLWSIKGDIEVKLLKEN